MKINKTAAEIGSTTVRESSTTAPTPSVEESAPVYGVIANIAAGIAYIAEYASAEDLCDPGQHFSLCFWSESWEECQECLEKNFPWALEVEEDNCDD